MSSSLLTARSKVWFLLVSVLFYSSVSCWTPPPSNHQSSHPQQQVRNKRNDVCLSQEASGSMSTTSPESAENEDFPQRIRVLGVCGGIGSGKSAACKILVSELNCLAHIDSDSIAHTIYEKGSQALSDVVAEFGSDLIDNATGEIDRKKLGAIVFADIQAMRRLERIVWPHVQNKIAAKIEQAKVGWETSGKTPVIVVEAAVLLDAGWQDFLDGVWVLSVPSEDAVQRLQENRGLTVQDAEKRIAAQQPRRGIGNLEEEVANKVVSAVIDNRGSLEDLKERLAEKLIDKAAWYSNSRSTALP